MSEFTKIPVEVSESHYSVPTHGADMEELSDQQLLSLVDAGRKLAENARDESAIRNDVRYIRERVEDHGGDVGLVECRYVGGEHNRYYWRWLTAMRRVREGSGAE